VAFTVTPELMSIVNNEGKNIIEPGKFKITIGGNQGDARSQALGASQVLEEKFEVI
jgi:beta-glucosidase